MIDDSAITPILAIILGAFIFGSVVTDKNVSHKEIAIANYKCAKANSTLKYFEMGSFVMTIRCENEAKFNAASELSSDYDREILEMEEGK